jgi:hypothetical protein
MKSSKLLLLAGSTLLLLSGSRVAAQSIISGWDFDNLSVGANSNPAPDLGLATGAASTLGFTNSFSTPGPSVDVSDALVATAANTDLGSSDTTSTSGVVGQNNIWRIRGGEPPGGTQAANGWSSAAAIGTQGALFMVPTTGFSNISLQFDWQSTKQGEANLQVEFTLNGGATFTNLSTLSITGTNSGGAVVTTNTSSSPNTVNGTFIHQGIITGDTWTDEILGNLAGIPGAANNPNFGFELVNATTGADDKAGAGTALNNSSGNWRFDEVQVFGSADAIPEPGTTALWVGLSGLGLALIVRRRRTAAV